MNDEPGLKWPPILFFTMSGIVFSLSLYLVATSAMKSEARANVGNVHVASAAGTESGIDEDQVRVILRRDEKNSFGKVDVIYRGIENDQIKLDVFILDLDPNYPYRREITCRQAKEGFRLGGLHFELISAGRAKAKLVWFPQG